MSDEKLTGLALLRAPFPENQIGQKPSGTKAQNECPASEKVNCAVCGGFHHPRIKHLSFIGHAALTDRLLDADPLWSWEPLAYDEQGLPRFDASGGLWGKLTVCGVTRIGYGHAQASQYKEIGSREKEVIGDLLRNIGMRFGAALELWHKGNLHADDDDAKPPVTPPKTLAAPQQPLAAPMDAAQGKPPDYAATLNAATTRQALGLAWQKIPLEFQPTYAALANQLKARLSPVKQVA
jgi:hypothetical protein